MAVKSKYLRLTKSYIDLETSSNFFTLIFILVSPSKALSIHNTDEYKIVKGYVEL